MGIRDTLGITGNETNPDGSSTLGASVGGLLDQGKDLAREYPTATKWVGGLAIFGLLFSMLGSIKDRLPGANTPGIGQIETLGVVLAAFVGANKGMSMLQGNLNSDGAGGPRPSYTSQYGQYNGGNNTYQLSNRYNGAASQPVNTAPAGQPGPAQNPQPRFNNEPVQTVQDYGLVPG